MRTRFAMLAATALAVACSRPAAPPAAPPALDSTPQRIERTFEGCDPTDPDCSRAVLSWPELRGGTEAGRAAAETWIRARLLGAIGERAPADPATLADEFLAGYGEFAREFPDSALSYQLERDIDLLSAPPGVISLSAREWVYTGGAHGMDSLALASFDAATGRRISLAALLRDGALPEFTALLERRFRALREIPDGISLAEAGFSFESGAFAPTDNFALTAEGLRFYWNPYEVASYADGPTDVLVKPGDVRPMLREGAPYAE